MGLICEFHQIFKRRINTSSPQICWKITEEGTPPNSRGQHYHNTKVRQKHHKKTVGQYHFEYRCENPHELFLSLSVNLANTMHPEDPHFPTCLPQLALPVELLPRLVGHPRVHGWPYKQFPPWGPSPSHQFPCWGRRGQASHSQTGGQFRPPTLRGNWDRDLLHSGCLQQSQSFGTSWARDQPCLPVCLQQSWPSYQKKVYTFHMEISLEILALMLGEGLHHWTHRTPT